MRNFSPLAIALLGGLFLVAEASAQESDSQRSSIVQRIASLRFGWGEEEPETKRPPENREASSRGLMGRLPRLNPSDLLPGESFSGNGSQRATSATVQSRTSGSNYRVAHRSTGSARSRVMRDLRSQQNRTTTSPTRQETASTAKPSASRTTPTRVASRSTTTAGSSTASRNPAPRPTASTQTAQASRPVVLQRNTNTRAGSNLSAQRPATTQPATPVLSEEQLRRGLLGSAVADSTQTTPRPRANTQTTKRVAAAVASRLASEPSTTQPSASDTKQADTNAGDDIEAILRAAADAEADTKQEIAKEEVVATAPVLPTAPPSPSEPVVPEPQVKAQATAPVVTKQPASPDVTPLPAEATLAAPERKSAPPTRQTAEVNQEAVRRKFEQDIEQSVSPRSAPSTRDQAFAAEQRYRPAQREEIHTSTDTDVLMSQRMPLIVSRVSGPRRIMIGREATYRVSIANRGDESADQLVTQINVPEWAEVVGSRSTNGVVAPPQTGSQGALVEWRMPELPPRAVQHLDLRIIARAGRPIELGVNWKHAPVGNRTIVEVQEPMLRMAVDGPSEVRFGQPQRYRLSLANPGTGSAENVVVRLTPPGGTERDIQRHTVGLLRAGESRTIDFEFTAQQAGQLALSAEAQALGDLSTNVTKELFCRKPELEVDWRGPSQKYAGSNATYYFRVRNPGTAPAEDVTLRLELPRGFKPRNLSGNGKVDPTGRYAEWRVGSLRPGDDYFTELQGIVSQPGANELHLAATDRDRIASGKTIATTEVITVADLKLEIGDPKGPLPVGRDTVYEVRVRNRGTSAAEAVNVVGLFSEGIEPYRVEGAEASIADGRVAIRTVERLAVGSELVIRIYAKAALPGTHIFRAEVLCTDLDIKLAAEETTRFYQEDPLEVGHSGGFGERR